ncbi:MAG: tetratricopeptide repeat protein [Nitrospinota bacterium]
MKGMIISLHLSKRLFCSFFLLSSFPLLSPFQVFSAETPSCDSPVARLVSVEGEVQMQKVEEKNWHPVSVERLFCAGDRVQVGENSRAVVQVSDHSLVNLDAESILSFTQVEKVDGFWVSLLKGIGHFISRVPRQLNVETPFVNALVEGTEFLIHVAENETLVTVFEGTVFAKNQSGDLRLKSGESGKAKLAQAPLKVQVVRPRDAVHWALYYPSILQFDEKRLEGHSQGAWQSRMAKSIKHFKSGDLKKAFDALSEITDAVDDSSFLLYRASLHLTVGQVAKAQSTLDNVLRQTPGDNNALALKAVIAVVQNDRETALAFANKSVEGFPKSAGPYLARSYVFQSGFKLAEARKDVETAVTQYPDNPLAWARLAELRLMFRDLDGALKAAKRAVAIDPGIAKTETVLGFTHLVRIEIASAKAAFKKAIAEDQGSPMSRLGLGLAMIREGELEAGRREIEIAAMLDPGHSLIRSYLGKAYYEEKRDHLAVEQYQMARELDPRDPTPDLYSAILNQTNNRPVQALQNIERSITLNENRAVYRSRLLLDEDLAARSVSLGRIYQVLGFQKRALVEGWSSLSLDPSNHSAHRLLADSYATLPRHQIARASELLQSQLLQPLNMTPIQPQLAETNLAILERGGPSRLSFNEFTSHFARNQIDFQLNGLAGSNDTLGNDFVVSTVQNRTSFSLGQFHYETDGFRKNNDLKHDIYNLFGQIAATSKLNIQAEFRRRKTHNGDLNLNFDPADFSLTDRREILQDTARVGGHFVPSNKSIFIFSTIYSGSEDEARDRPGEVAPASDDLIDKKAYQGEAQYLFWHDRFNFIAGVGRYEVDEESQEILDWSLVSFSPFSPLFPFNGMVCPPPVSPWEEGEVSPKVS